MSSSIVMDHNNIPSCSLYRLIGTVIVRLKMEVSSVLCCQRDVCPAYDCRDSIHRPSRCEQCTRTRLISKCDCDSDIVDKSRSYRSSTSRSRYVNVCAAVCLLLLVGCLSPQSSAAPVRTRAVMSRQRRATNVADLWENPCNYADPNATPIVSDPPKNVAAKLIKQAEFAQSFASDYKDEFAKLFSYKNYEDLDKVKENDSWLGNFQLPEEVFPNGKVVNVPDEYLDSLIAKIDAVLPSMHKGLKLIVAGLNSLSTQGLNDSLADDKSLKPRINDTTVHVQEVLCQFDALMTVRNAQKLPLAASDVPEINTNNAFPLYRDTLNYLEYLCRVFKKLYGIN